MTRTEAFGLLRQKISNANLVKHMLAAEAVMRALAARCGGDPDEWGLCGLLHDYDYEETANDFSRHGAVTAELLAGRLDDGILRAIRAHAGLVERTRAIDKAIYCADPVTGFIVAAALVLPEKKLAAVKVETLLNRFREKHFAKGASRPQMESCEDLGLTLDEFFGISLGAMQSVAGELGL